MEQTTGGKTKLTDTYKTSVKKIPGKNTLAYSAGDEYKDVGVKSAPVVVMNSSTTISSTIGISPSASVFDDFPARSLVKTCCDGFKKLFHSSVTKIQNVCPSQNYST